MDPSASEHQGEEDDVASGQVESVHNDLQVGAKTQLDSKFSHASVSLRVVEATRKAELVAQAAALKKRQALRVRELELEMERELLEIGTEIAIAGAREMALSTESAPRGQELHGTPRGFPEPQAKSTPAFDVLYSDAGPPSLSRHDAFDRVSSDLNPRAPEYSVPSRISGDFRHQHEGQSVASEGVMREMVQRMEESRHSQEQLTQIIEDQHQRTLLPPSSIAKFGGDFTEYRTFVRSFDCRVANRTFDDNERLHYLEQYTVGRPRELVRSCMHMDMSKGYSEARRLLEVKYGNEYEIALAYVDKAVNWPQAKGGDAVALDQYAVFLTGCRNAMNDIKYVCEIEHPRNMQKIVQKLPVFIQDRWSRRANTLMRSGRGHIRFSTLVDFIEEEASVALNPIYGSHMRHATSSETKKKSDSRKTSLATGVVTADHTEETKGAKSKTPDAYSAPCLFCMKDHTMAVCFRLRKKKHREKLRILQSKNLCFGCLEPGHMAADCARRSVCKVCEKKHPTILHFGKSDGEHGSNGPKVSDSDTADATSVKEIGSGCVGVANGFSCGKDAKDSKVTMPIVPVKVKVKDSDQMVETYAFLDSGSKGTFCTDSLLRQLRTSGVRTNFVLKTMAGRDRVSSQVVTGLQVCSLDGSNMVSLPKVYSQPEIPVGRGDIPSQDYVNEWPYLQDVCLETIDAGVGLLIGNDVPVVMEPWRVINSQGDGPYAVKTLLGWAISGPLGSCDGEADHGECPNGVPHVGVNFISMEPCLDKMMEQHFNHEFSERSCDEKLENSQEDIKFLRMVSESIQFKDGQYQIGLPFRNPDFA